MNMCASVGVYRGASRTNNEQASSPARAAVEHRMHHASIRCTRTLILTVHVVLTSCLLYTSPSPRDRSLS
eukprot:2938483-Pyramimonas_sp.AAC.1